MPAGVPGTSKKRVHPLGWDTAGVWCMRDHPTKYVKKSVCADGWWRHLAADDAVKTVVCNACFAFSQTPPCTTGGVRDCVMKMGVFKPVRLAAGDRKHWSKRIGMRRLEPSNRG